MALAIKGWCFGATLVAGQPMVLVWPLCMAVKSPMLPCVHMAPLSGPVWCLAAMAAFAPFSPSHSLGGFGPLGHPKCGEPQPCSTQQSRGLAQHLQHPKLPTRCQMQANRWACTNFRHGGEIWAHGENRGPTVSGTPMHNLGLATPTTCGWLTLGLQCNHARFFELFGF